MMPLSKPWWSYLGLSPFWRAWTHAYYREGWHDTDRCGCEEDESGGNPECPFNGPFGRWFARLTQSLLRFSSATRKESG